MEKRCLHQSPVRHVKALIRGSYDVLWLSIRVNRNDRFSRRTMFAWQTRLPRLFFVVPMSRIKSKYVPPDSTFRRQCSISELDRKPVLPVYTPSRKDLETSFPFVYRLASHDRGWKEKQRKRKRAETVFPSAVHFLPHCRTPLWPCEHLFKEPLLPFELLLLLLPELDTLSDLLMDFFVGSRSRSSIWRIVLCLRLNGLVYISICRLVLLSKTIPFQFHNGRKILPEQRNRHFLSLRSYCEYVSRRTTFIVRCVSPLERTALERLAPIASLAPYALLVLRMIAKRHSGKAYIRATFGDLRSGSDNIDSRLEARKRSHRCIGSPVSAVASRFARERTLAKVKGEGFLSTCRDTHICRRRATYVRYRKEKGKK